ncbi:hypothetical protein [Halobaculum sp. MBLA0143]|uniref:hypothetical protein n=1 Tax=Halobaculum sp. MBLA0143 TaxID=3079933 RepID=UPI003523BE69
MQRLTRRRLCGVGAAVGGSWLGGCLSVSPGGEVSLFAGDEGLADVFLLRESLGAPHVARHVETLRRTLVDTGSVETLETTIDGRVSHPDTSVSPAVSRPRFVEADGYYRISPTEATPTTVDEWVVWFEPVDAAPDGVESIDTRVAEADRFDAQILRRAKATLGTALAADETLGDRPLRDRGYVLFDPTTPEETALVPNPPFEHAVFEGEENFLPDEQPVRLRVRRGPVETTRYTNTVERVADDRADFADYLDANVLDATFDADDLPADRREILDTAAGDGYREDGTPSEPFRTLLERLGVETFEHDDRFTRTVTYRYAGTVYAATCTVD